MDLRRRRRLQGAQGVDLVQCSIAGDVAGQLRAAARPLVPLLVVVWISGAGDACRARLASTWRSARSPSTSVASCRP
ncbi:hypothetical protein VDS42_22660, partial [Xanthomonas campestris pv. campestris]|nr:hypothetical protein [Xanthomonas campestris pv. campestris]